MSDKFEQLKAQTSALTPTEKAALARLLIDEIDNLTDGDVDKLWADEAQRRYEAYKSGTIAARPGSEVMNIARRKLR